MNQNKYLISFFFTFVFFSIISRFWVRVRRVSYVDYYRAWCIGMPPDSPGTE